MKTLGAPTGIQTEISDFKISETSGPGEAG